MSLLLLAFVIGLAGLGFAALVAFMLSSRRARVVLAWRRVRLLKKQLAVAAKEDKRRDLTRALADARLDLRASLNGDPTSYELARQAAHEDDIRWQAERQAERSRRERERGRARAAERIARSARRAELGEAAARAAESRVRFFREQLDPLPGGDAARLTAAMEIATSRLTAAELAAQEAAERAEVERQAAQLAASTRMAAEQAARQAQEQAAVRGEAEPRSAGATDAQRKRSSKASRGDDRRPSVRNAEALEPVIQNDSAVDRAPEAEREASEDSLDLTVHGDDSLAGGAGGPAAEGDGVAPAADEEAPSVAPDPSERVSTAARRSRRPDDGAARRVIDLRPITSGRPARQAGERAIQLPGNKRSPRGRARPGDEPPG